MVEATLCSLSRCISRTRNALITLTGGKKVSRQRGVLFASVCKKVRFSCICRVRTYVNVKEDTPEILVIKMMHALCIYVARNCSAECIRTKNCVRINCYAIYGLLSSKFNQLFVILKKTYTLIF